MLLRNEHLTRFEMNDPETYAYDRDGNIKMDVTRTYVDGVCHVNVHAIRRGRSKSMQRWAIARYEFPVPMKREVLREAMLNVATLTAMELGISHTIRFCSI